MTFCIFIIPETYPNSLVEETSQPANIGLLDVPRTSHSSVSRTCPKDPIWPSWGRPNLTSWGRPRMTSRGRPNLTFKGRPWEFDSGRHLDDLESTQTWMSQIFFNFSFRNYSIDQIYLNAFQHSRCIGNSAKLLRWSIFCKIS